MRLSLRLSLPLITLALAAGSLPSAEAQAKPKAKAACSPCRVKSYLGAVNSNDVERTLRFFADRVEWAEGTAPAISLDRQAVRDRLAWDAAHQTKVTWGEISIDGDHARVSVTQKSQFLELLGLPEQRYRLTLRMQDNLINRVVVEPLETETAALSRALAPFATWAKADHGEELTRIWPEQRLVRNDASAKSWQALLREWRGGSARASH
jgi:hypothetical protein